MPKKVPFLFAPVLVVLVVLVSAVAAVAAVAAAAAATMRLDYYHTGTATQEIFSVDRVVIEPAPWPGNPQKTVDETNLGKYLFEVRDRATNRLLYSRGFASIFGEWETTEEAKNASRTFRDRKSTRLNSSHVAISYA